MLRAWAIAACSALGASLCAQGLFVEVDTLRALRPFGPAEVYSFPFIRTPDDPGVGERISRNLQVELLGSVRDSVPETFFEPLWGRPDEYGDAVDIAVQSISWSVERPLPDVLVVTFSAEGCGAYCEGYTTYRSYAFPFGTLLSWDDLLWKEERDTVEDSLAHWWRQRVHEHMRGEELALGTRGLSVEEAEHAHAVMSLYRSCLERRAQGHVPVSEVEPLEQGLRVHVASCGAHFERAIDELGQVEIVLPYTWLEPYITPGLRSLFIR